MAAAAVEDLAETAQFLQLLIDRETEILHAKSRGEAPGDRGEVAFDPLFVTETTRDNFKYKLNHADLEALLDHFHLKLGEDDLVAVVGDSEQLKRVVAEHEKSANGSLVVILHQPPDHWATMVFWKEKHLFFADSKRFPADGQYSGVVNRWKRKNRYYVKSLPQQCDADEVNCGLWALCNAEKIRSWLANRTPEYVAKYMQLPTVKDEKREAHFQDLRLRLMGWLIYKYRLKVEPYRAACNGAQDDDAAAMNQRTSPESPHRDKSGRFCKKKYSTKINPAGPPRVAHAGYSDAQLVDVVDWLLTDGYSYKSEDLLNLKKNTPSVRDVPVMRLHNLIMYLPYKSYEYILRFCKNKKDVNKIRNRTSRKKAPPLSDSSRSSAERSRN